MAERLRDAYRRGKTHALAVIAEGAKCGVHELMEYYGAHRKSIGFDLRVTRLGHVVRGGIPSAADRVLATRLGAAAIDTLARGTACWWASSRATSSSRRSPRSPAARARPTRPARAARVMAI